MVMSHSWFHQHVTIVGTPQYNGLVERFNMIILERVRCIMLSVGVPNNFWNEASTITVFLIIRCPSTTMEMKTFE